LLQPGRRERERASDRIGEKIGARARAKKIGVLHRNSISKKRQKKYPRKLTLGYIGKGKARLFI
jgi:hypothetical protein